MRTVSLFIIAIVVLFVATGCSDQYSGVHEEPIAQPLFGPSGEQSRLVLPEIIVDGCTIKVSINATVVMAEAQAFKMVDSQRGAMISFNGSVLDIGQLVDGQYEIEISASNVVVAKLGVDIYGGQCVLAFRERYPVN